MSPLFLWLALAWAQQTAEAEVPVDETVEEAAIGPDRESPPGVAPSEWMALPEPEVHELRDGTRTYHTVRPSRSPRCTSCAMA